MFAKLLKYEWKATGPLIGILALALLGLSLLAGGAIRLSQIPTENEMLGVILTITAVLGSVFFFLALVCFSFASVLLILYRFYKNKFTDEGYLTFTLPVNSHQIFLSSWLNLVIWQVICMVVIIASLLLTVSVGGVYPDDRSVFLDMRLIFQDLFEILGDSAGLRMQVLYIVSMLASWLYGSVLMLTCIVLGAAWAKKHKLLLAFALYYGISGVFSVIVSVVSMVVMITGIDNTDPLFSFTATALSTAGLCLIMTVAGYFLSVHMMSKRLNLN